MSQIARIAESSAYPSSSFFETCKQYVTLCKPRVVMLMILTSMVGMCMATTASFSVEIFFWGNVGIALMASAAAAINHCVDQRIDRLMRRTQHRPIAQGKIDTRQALIFAAVLCVLGLGVLCVFVNTLTAILTFFTLIGYAVIYTMILKYQTPQNIVIGGIAGAAPPLLGWVAVTGHIDPGAILLMLIIFVWTPPHFWALCIDRQAEYAKANVPMFPIVYGERYTKLHIVLYTLLLCAVTLLPFAIGLSGWIYLIVAVLLNARFVQWTIRLWKSTDTRVAMSVFRYSIVYLMVLFIALVVDHFL